MIAGLVYRCFHSLAEWLRPGLGIGLPTGWRNGLQPGGAVLDQKTLDRALGDTLKNIARGLLERPEFSDHGQSSTPYVSFDVACVALIAFLMLTILVHVHTNVAGEFKISYGNLGPTEMRAFAILLNAAMFFYGPGLIERAIGNINLSFRIYDLGVSCIALLLFGFFFNYRVEASAVVVQVGRIAASFLPDLQFTGPDDKLRALLFHL